MASENAAWDTTDETTFINFLIEHASAASDGGNFKQTTFTATAAVVDLVQMKGCPKTTKACRNKWNMLRCIFCVIQEIQAKSGWSWGDKTGASITPDMEHAWADFIKIHKEAKPFKNKNWIHLHKMSLLMPATVKGTHSLSGMDITRDEVEEDTAEEDMAEEDTELPSTIDVMALHSGS
ncbi:hypothetical protein CVT25_000811 [Psilocybe cyanescens]|uniref:Myb/SANT-like domain-containing protein n=1 Tax=Psilocybe cyanescens TaxID=93625 RepID=A0A409W5B5_PSICY|nr:hypothetical protein CVT25_000811 [Psilocybe cyanescens]